jgi:acetoacetyl-CoA synthetase
MTTTEPMLWAPDAPRIESTEISAFIRYVNKKCGLLIEAYDQLYHWSISEKEAFWSCYWDFAGIVGEKGDRMLIDGDDIENAIWFPDAQSNYAENLLQTPSDEIAIYFKAENKRESSLSYQQLHDQVSAVANWLKSHGVVKGDRVAAYMANIPETVIAMLAATSLGAIWTSTSPDFGAQSVIERFGQTRPKILFTQDGYFYNGKSVDIRQKVAEIRSAIDSLEHVVNVSFLGLEAECGVLDWSDLLSSDAGQALDFVACSFNDPLFILYSSGTTGQPKCITHKVGGSLLQHRKEHQLHCDIKPGDKVFYFTTCGWMMWNWLTSALASRAALVLYDGSPFQPSGNVLWDYADAVGISLFGTSAKYIDALKKHAYEPAKTHALDSIRTVCSTGSVLAPESFDFVYNSIKRDVCLSSISGGTDIMSCFVLGCPILPVYRGQSQCRGLGMAVEVYDDEGKSITDKKGELVCTQTFPSQPAFFWGDEGGKKYHDAYFAVYDNVWHHGDYVSLTPEGGVIIYGRSDATLNPGGVRIGTAEIYRHVEQLDEVIESIVVGQDWEDDVRVILFVVLQDGLQLDDELSKKIKVTVRARCTPRHVPAKVIQVREIPRTKSGKIVELAVREVIHGRPVKNIHALANPEALELYKDLAALA